MAIVLAAIAMGVIAFEGHKMIENHRRTVIYQQAEKMQSALNEWVTMQTSIAAARAKFQKVGSAYVPIDLATLVTSLQEGMDKKIPISVDGDHVTTENQKEFDAYMTIDWPDYDVRGSYPQVHIFTP